MKNIDLGDKLINAKYKIDKTVADFGVNRAVLSVNTKNKQVKILYPDKDDYASDEEIFTDEDDMVYAYENTSTSSKYEIIIAFFGREFYWTKVANNFDDTFFKM